jgi:hypothetical protein
MCGVRGLFVENKRAARNEKKEIENGEREECLSFMAFSQIGII